MVKRFINVFALSTLFLICSVRLRLTITTEGRGEQIKQIKQIHLLPRATLVVYNSICIILFVSGFATVRLRLTNKNK